LHELRARWDGPAIADANACEHERGACSGERARVVDWQLPKDNPCVRFVKDGSLPSRDKPCVCREDGEQLDAHDVEQMVGPEDGKNWLWSKGLDRLPVELLVVLSEQSN